MRQSKALKTLDNLFEVVVKSGWKTPTELTKTYSERIMRLRSQAQAQRLPPFDFWALLTHLEQHTLPDGLDLPASTLVGTNWEPEPGMSSAQVTEVLLAAAKARRVRTELLEEV